MIVHHLAQAKSALHAACHAGREIQLQSAPGAAACAGVGYLKALGDAIDHELLIDCGDDAGLVMAALRTGSRKLMFSGPPDEHQRLGQIAGKSGALLLDQKGLSRPLLALSPDDDGDALNVWLVPKSKA